MKSTNLLILILITLALVAPAAKAQIAIGQFTSNPDAVSPGEPVSLELILENFGEEDIEDVAVALDLTQAPFAPLGSSSEKIIDEIKENENEAVNFVIKALPNAAPGTYKIPVIITHSQVSKTSFISIEVYSDAKLDVLIDNTELVKVNDQGKVTLKFVNNGFSKISFLKVTLLESPFYEILSPQTLYVGEVDVADFETEEYTLIAKKEDPILLLTLEYRDAQNDYKVVPKLVELSIYSEQEAEQLGLNESNGSFSAVIVGLVILILLVFLYRRRKRKKKNVN